MTADPIPPRPRDEALVPTDQDLAAFRDALTRVSWTKTTAYPRWMEHEYIVQHNNPSDFIALQCIIRAFGYDARFFRETYHYLEVEGYKYWVFDKVLNRETLQQEREHINRGSREYHVDEPTPEED